MNLIIGICTGRCGSQSLSDIMSKQQKTVSFHEMYWRTRGTTFREKFPILKINNSIMPKLYSSSLKTFFKKYEIHGVEALFDIGPYTKDCYKEILKSFPKAKFIVLKRNFADFKRSYIKVKSIKGSIFNLTIPFENSLEYYNHIYSDEILSIENSFVLNTEDLNSHDRIEEMLVWCGFKHPNVISSNKDELRKIII